MGCMAVLPADAADTTYSRTRPVPKQNASEPARGSDPQSAAPDDQDDQDDNGGGNAGFSYHSNAKGIRYCFDADVHAETLGGVAAAILLMPFWMGICSAGYQAFHGPAHIFSGEADMGRWSQNRWHYGAGFNIGGAWLPGAAGGLISNFHFEVAHGIRSGAFAGDQVRLQTGLRATWLGTSVDYERTVYADGVPVALQHDAITGYKQYGLPLLADFLWQPGSAGFYLAGGGGALFQKETLDFERKEGLGDSRVAHAEVRTTLRPALDLALGRYGGGSGDHIFWRFEIKYQAVPQFPGRTTSFPSDNSRLSQSLAWDWAWMW